MTTALWELASKAEVFDLAQPMRRGMPQSPNHPPFRMLLERRHGDMVRSDGGSAANELIVTGGHVGTHVDALAHVSHDGYVYGGRPAAELQSHDGFSALGIDEFTPFVGRAVHLDVARLHGTKVLPPGHRVTAEELAAAEEAGARIHPGDAVLIGTGWSRMWDDGPAFVGHADGVPGPDSDAARWLAAKGARVVGGETIAFEHIAAGRGHAELPVHRILLVEEGVNIVETMRLHELADAAVTEFLLMLAPLPVVGATGAPARPLAVVPRG
ncbi:cyclase family protein [Yinghuangia sp. YIM S09857]|uniref:cyclase family protein n=1 Tax=Yinghuangia sp. YIM S09857 TaxID=3436929 RepID=UPI003F52C300